MTPDQTYALGLGVASVSLLIPAIRYPVLEAVSHPLVVLGSVFVVVWTLSIGFTLTAIVLTAIVLFLMRESMTFALSRERQVYLDKREDDARFNPWYSVDLQVANRTLTFDAPRLGHVDYDATPLLKFPPTAADLEQLSGR